MLCGTVALNFSLSRYKKSFYTNFEAEIKGFALDYH